MRLTAESREWPLFEATIETTTGLGLDGVPQAIDAALVALPDSIVTLGTVIGATDVLGSTLTTRVRSLLPQDQVEDLVGEIVDEHVPGFFTSWGLIACGLGEVASATAVEAGERVEAVAGVVGTVAETGGVFNSLAVIVVGIVVLALLLRFA